ncbi:MAG: L-2-hydroxyglutarate oxidase [Desulfobacterales bacterium]|nr:L-2-hydroxyglutarate oxidase [Desulfobacterales bacterium]
MTDFDITLIGGGIVGTATALELKRRYPDARILLIEKEKRFAAHQTGHNSGVIHAGVYYQPGSLKADFCKRGSRATIDFCRAHNLPFLQCGKLLVATTPKELERMDALEKRCGRNKIETRRLSRKDLNRLEPNIFGLGALKVPATGITDFVRITAKMAGLFKELGGTVKTGSGVTGIYETGDMVIVDTGSGQISTGYLIACGGLQADRLARMMDIDIDFMIIPFRGEYYRLPDRLNRIVSHLIYPIPDPDLPFLGVHLTPMIDHCITVGPNAALGWKREGYRAVNIDIRDTLEMLAFPGFWKVMANHLGSGIGEWIDSVYKPGYLKRIRKYCPSLEPGDLTPYPAGIRAQAVLKDGSLVHDFLFAESPRSLHVCNAPSPAATSAMPIGEYLSDRAAEKFKL